MKQKIPFLLLVAVLMIFSATCSTNCQYNSLVVEWHDYNDDPVTFDLFEVAAPPDTNIVIQIMNPYAISDCDTVCRYEYMFFHDNKDHYFRMWATRNDSIHSILSNTAWIYAVCNPISPVIMRIFNSKK